VRTAALNTQSASPETVPFWSVYVLSARENTQDGAFCVPRPKVTRCPAAV